MKRGLAFFWALHLLSFAIPPNVCGNPLDNWRKALEWYSFEGIIHGNGQFVAYGPGPAYSSTHVLISPDAKVWSKRLLSQNRAKGLAFGNGVYVLVVQGNGGAVLTSTNGIDWGSSYSNPAPETFESYDAVDFLNGHFVVLAFRSSAAGEQILLTSTNGASWNRYPLSISISKIAYGNGVYAATDRSGRFLSSIDAINWTERHPGETDPFIYSFGAVAYGNGIFLGANQNGIFRSPDGLTWTPATDTLVIPSLTFAKDRFIAFSSDNTVYSSLDGFSWEALNTGTVAQLRAAATDGTNIVLAGNAVVSSSNGVNWLKLVEEFCVPISVHEISNRVVVVANSYPNLSSFISTNAEVWRRHDSSLEKSMGSVVRIEDELLALPESFRGYYASRDGEHWEPRATDQSYYFRAIVKGDNQYVAVANTHVGMERGVFLTSTDGITWTNRLIFDRPWWGSVSLVFGNGMYVASKYEYPANGARYYSSDAVNWTGFTISGGNPITSAIFAEGLFIASHWSSSELRSSVDGRNWTVRAQPGSVLDGLVHFPFTSLAYGGGQFLAAGGIDQWTGVISGVVPALWSSWNGTNWLKRDAPTNLVVQKAFHAADRFYLLTGDSVYQSIPETPVPPQFSRNPERIPNKVVLSITSEPGTRWLLYSSTDLRAWALESVVTNITEQATHTRTSNLPQRFYRLEEY